MVNMPNTSFPEAWRDCWCFSSCRPSCGSSVVMMPVSKSKTCILSWICKIEMKHSFSKFPEYFSDLVGTVRDFLCPRSPVGFGIARGGCDTPLCLCLLVDNARIIGLQQENSHYSQCFIHPPSSTTISPYWVTPRHTNKTLSPDHQAPTYSPNPSRARRYWYPLFLAELPYPTPL